MIAPIDSPKDTLYSVANDAMLEIIDEYLELATLTNGFAAIDEAHLRDVTHRRIVLGGIGSPLNEEHVSAADVVAEWTRMQAIEFSAEEAVTRGVYVILSSKVATLLSDLKEETDGFKNFPALFISQNPQYLPVYQRLLNVASKSRLKDLVGSVNDNSISKPAGQRISEQLALRANPTPPSIVDLQASMAPTLEGIVRDLVGRVLLENIVASALDAAGVKYKREDEYSGITGVVYDFRADFVMPDEHTPKVFIEVRKSSSRHASLYAKDKMFSAINWKGHNPDLMAIIITEGPWTGQTLQVMARVYDYVVPLRKAPQVAQIIAQYLAGDKSKLKLLIDFKIRSTIGEKS